MVYKKFQSANNAKGQLLAAAGTLATSIVLQTGGGGLFPSHNGTTDKDYPVSIKKYVTGGGGDYTKQEIVLVTARTGDTLTITRAYDACPLTSSAVTQSQTALSFDSSDYVELNFVAKCNEDMQDEIDLKANDSEVVHNTGIETVAGEKTFSTFPKTPSSAPTTDYQVANKKYVDDVLLANIIPTLVNEGRVGEDISSEDSIFPEPMVLDAEATSEQNIGDVSANTKVSFPAIGSGEKSGGVKMSLAVDGSPSVALGVRIETDNAGDPSGTLADVNAITTISAGDLTASLDETVLKMGTDVDRDTSITYTTTPATTYKSGEGITISDETIINTINKDSLCTATTCYILDSDKNILHTATFSGDTATFVEALLTKGNYYIVVDSGGASYNTRKAESITYPTGDTILQYTSGLLYVVDITDPNPYQSLDVLSNTSSARGIKYKASHNLYLKEITRFSGCTGARCRVYDGALSLLATESFTGDIATLSTQLEFSTDDVFYVIIDNNGSTYLPKGDQTGAGPVAGTAVEFTTGRNLGVGSVPFMANVDDIITEEIVTLDPTDGFAIESVNVVDGITLTEGQKYHFVLYQGTYGSETINASNYYKSGYDVKNTKTRGLRLFDGSVYSSTDEDKFISMISDFMVARLLAKTDANYSYKLPESPMIAKTSKTVGNILAYDFDGIADISGFSDGDVLFVSDTPGELSTTPGTIEYLVGLMISDTQMLFRNQTRKAIGTSGGAVTVTIGFYPSIIMTSVVGGGNTYLDETHISNKTATGFDISGAYDWVCIG